MQDVIASNGTTLIQAVPLVPFSVSWLDIVLPPCLIATSFLLFALFNERQPVKGACIYRAKTAHARFLPERAKHRFSYPVLYLGLDLDELERRTLDLGSLFAYSPRKDQRTLTSVHPRAYLTTGADEKHGIKQRLVDLLAGHNVDPVDAHRIHTVTMPAYLSFEGINPLTTHYCYDSDQTLKVVVLEVHNTFEERHLYVLKCGIDEDPQPAKGYSNQWTFPRAFHVSPFNDRSGFYTVSVVDPIRAGKVDVRILTLTKNREKKLYAALQGRAIPLSRSSLLQALVRRPIDLLLTSPRIMYEAFKLHFKKGLDVFPRPEPFVRPVDDRLNRDNVPQVGGQVGSVGWQDEAAIDLAAQDAVSSFLQRRLNQLATQRNVRVILRPANTARPTTTIEPGSGKEAIEERLPVEVLEIFYTTPRFFTDLMVSPSARLALELGSHTMARWTTTNDELFVSLFDDAERSASTDGPSRKRAQQMRIDLMKWSMSFGPEPLSTTTIDVPSRHPLDDSTSTTTMSPNEMERWLKRYARETKAAYWIFRLTGARFVKGTESWTEWARWLASKEGRPWHIQRDDVGSVLSSADQ